MNHKRSEIILVVILKMRKFLRSKVCLLLYHAKTTQWIWVKFGTDVDNKGKDCINYTFYIVKTKYYKL